MIHRQILLTGATGALGPALAAELVRAGAAERIGVLMRGSEDEVEGRFARWREVVESLLGPEDCQGLGRVLAVRGDVCREGIGIEKEGVSRETDVVIHAAADTNFSSEQRRQWDVNVEGTRRTLRWAEGCRGLKRFLLVSSVFVSGSRTGRIDERVTDERPEFVTYYQRTKWEAEHVALQSGLPVGVARISLILGSHATGGVHASGAVHSLIKWFARGLVPVIPGLPEARGDVIATETAAQSLTRMVMADWPAGQAGRAPICHIAAGEQAPRMTELIDCVYQHFAKRPAWLRRRIPRPKLVERADFERIIDTVNAAGHAAAAQALKSVNRFLPDLLFPKTYETRAAEALLGGPLPRYDWRETMERVIRFCFPADK